MDTFLEWKIVVGRRRLTSGHRTVGGEEEDRNNHEGTMKSRKAGTWKNIWIFSYLILWQSKDLKLYLTI